MRTRDDNSINTTQAFGGLNKVCTGYDNGDISGVGGTVGDITPQGYSSTFPKEQYQSVITDDPSPLRGPKYVDHIKTHTYWYDSNIHQHVLGPNCSFHTYGPGSAWYEFGGSAPSALAESDLHVEYQKTDEQLVRDAVHDFYTGVNDASGIEDVIESSGLLSSLQSLYRTLNDKATLKAMSELTFNNKRDLLARLGGKGAKRLFRRFANVTSGGYLLYSFALSPLLSDMKAVKKSIGSFKRQADKLQLDVNRVVSIRRTCHGTVGYSDGAGGSRGNVYYPNYKQYLLQGAVAKKVAVVRGTRGRKFDFLAYKRLSYAIERFGSSGPLDLAWEFIPWSFVLDWFFDVRSITDRIDNLITGNTKKILDVCFSTKVEGTSVMSLRSQSPYEITEDGIVLYQSQLSHYHREPVQYHNQVGLAGRFGKKQLSLLVALLHQKVANRVR